jgi:hypothetical protein
VAQTLEVTFEDVLRAGRVLFGPAFSGGASGWRGDLKVAYRRRAMETHPDRAPTLGRSEGEMAQEFRAVVEAYRLLSSLRAGRVRRGAATAAPARRAGAAPAGAAPGPRGQSRSPRPARPDEEPRVRASPRPEDLPRRKLRFAEYLYYSGRASWSDLAEAIAWQRSNRARIGRIAVELGFLSPADVRALLERRRGAGAAATPIGEWAVQLGYLTRFQLLAALGRQQRLQHRIGEFFVARGLVDPDEIEGIRSCILRHNVRFR